MKTINKSICPYHTGCFSIISMTAPAEIRYSWHGLNPWNTIQAVPLMFKRFLKMDDWIIYSLSVLIIAYLWWRIYALVNKFRRS
ncbi:MAG: hypothetical protein ACLSDJ_05670 [Butyricimonas faecihominis]